MKQQVRDVQANALVLNILPFKDQRSADVVRKQLSDLGRENKQRSTPSFQKQENCGRNQSSRGQITVNKPIMLCLQIQMRTM